MRFVVNATALRASGALTILKQFINRAAYTEHEYIVFLSNDVLLDDIEYKNITFRRVVPQNWAKRILWDFYGFKKK